MNSKKIRVATAMAGLLLLAGCGCGDNGEKPKPEHPKSEHPKSEHPK